MKKTQIDTLVVQLQLLNEKKLFLREAIKINNEEICKLEKKPYSEVINLISDKVKINSINKVELEIILRKIEAKAYLLKKLEMINNLGNEIELVECVVRESANIRFNAEISRVVRFDITNDISFIRGVFTPEKAMQEEEFRDHEEVSNCVKIQAIKIGNKYFFEAD